MTAKLGNAGQTDAIGIEKSANGRKWITRDPRTGRLTESPRSKRTGQIVSESVSKNSDLIKRLAKR